jgi:NADH-quinone oxidoreductase subunit G
LKPRFNPGVNDYWMCDEGRFGWKFTNDPARIAQPIVRRGTRTESPGWEKLADIVRLRLQELAAKHGPASVAVQLSPEMACEEAWLLAKFIRQVAPEATLVLGDVQVVGEKERFPAACTPGEEKFIIQPEKNPNRMGIEALLKGMGGNITWRENLYERIGKGEFKALWVVGGYPQAGWPQEPLLKAAAQVELLIVQDMFPNPLTEQAEIVLPFCSWLEREGSFMNHAGRVQPFERVIQPPDGGMHDGQYLYQLAGFSGLYTGTRVREMMAKSLPALVKLHVPPPMPKHAH